MFHTILFIIYILMILTVIFIERKSPTEALLWVFIMICLPYAGNDSLSCFRKYSGNKADGIFKKKKTSEESFRVHADRNV